MSADGIHLAHIDLCGGGVIDECDGRAVVVGDDLAGGCLHEIADLSTAVGVAQQRENGAVERALGIAAGMIFGEKLCRCQSEVPPAPIVAWRNGDAC